MIKENSSWPNMIYKDIHIGFNLYCEICGFITLVRDVYSLDYLAEVHRKAVHQYDIRGGYCQLKF